MFNTNVVLLQIWSSSFFSYLCPLFFPGSWRVVLLDEALDLLLDLLEPVLEVGRLCGVYLVDGHEGLLDAEGVVVE